MITVSTSDIKIITISHSWSQRGVSHFFRTCRSTEIHEEKLMANLKYNFGNVSYEENKYAIHMSQLMWSVTTNGWAQHNEAKYSQIRK